ncbi:MAG: hypothetical protein HFH86_00980 [Bacilli bacterium]|jgi:hypothetical protein|nr:hypothetical protein [Bacilli bacterium]
MFEKNLDNIKYKMNREYNNILKTMKSEAKSYLCYSKPIVGTSQEYADLCEVRPYNSSIDGVYIRANDLYTLLKEKGFSEDMISIIWGEYGFGPRYLRTIKNEGIYINYNSIMNLGKIEEQKQKTI